MFYIDVLDSLQRGYEEKINWENLVLEINSVKHAYNVSMKEVNMMLTRSILSLPDSLQKVGFRMNDFVRVRDD